MTRFSNLREGGPHYSAEWLASLSDAELVGEINSLDSWDGDLLADLFGPEDRLGDRDGILDRHVIRHVAARAQDKDLFGSDAVVDIDDTLHIII